MSSSNPDNIASQTTGDGGSVAVGIVLGILAGIFVILVLLSRYELAAQAHPFLVLFDCPYIKLRRRCRVLCRNRGESNPDDLEAGKRKRLASILKLDGVAPSRAYGKDSVEVKSEPRSSGSFDDVIVWYVSCSECRHEE